MNLNVSGGNLTFSWSDPSFILESSTNIAGPWVPVSGASNGFTTNATPYQPSLFFRLHHPGQMAE
jgi:hypothetical protein